MKLLAQKGFTVVELMIAMAIGLLISAVVVTVFSTSATTYRVAGSIAALQETGRVAIAAIERDAHTAGFRGCNSNNVLNSGPILNIITGPTVYTNALDVPLKGYNHAGAGWTPGLDAGYPGIIANTDVLVLRVPNLGPISVTNTMATAAALVQVSSTAGLAVGDRMMIADCSAANAFRLTAIAGATLGHDTTLNTLANFQDQNGPHAFGDDAYLYRYTTRAYYIGASSNGVAGATSLWVKENDGVPDELAENVERFEVLYGEDLNGDFVADVFRNASTVANFANVVAIQVHLLTKGSRDNETLVITPYQFYGSTIIPTDHFVRRIYSATMQLRNRVL